MVCYKGNMNVFVKNNKVIKKTYILTCKQPSVTNEQSDLFDSVGVAILLQLRVFPNYCDRNI